jgi:hypothetical protein
VDQENIQVSRGMGEELPPANDKFANPATGGDFAPDLENYPPELAGMLEEDLNGL